MSIKVSQMSLRHRVNEVPGDHDKLNSLESALAKREWKQHDRACT